MNEQHMTQMETEKTKSGKRGGEAFKKEKKARLLAGTVIDEWIQEHYAPEDILGKEGLLAQLTKAVVERAVGAATAATARARRR